MCITTVTAASRRNKPTLPEVLVEVRDGIMKMKRTTFILGIERMAFGVTPRMSERNSVPIPDHRVGSPWLKELYDVFAPIREEAWGFSEEEINEAIDDAVKAVRQQA